MIENVPFERFLSVTGLSSFQVGLSIHSNLENYVCVCARVCVRVYVGEKRGKNGKHFNEFVKFFYTYCVLSVRWPVQILHQSERSIKNKINSKDSHLLMVLMIRIHLRESFLMVFDQTHGQISI